MWIDGDELYLAFTGRCAAITKTKIGKDQFKEYKKKTVQKLTSIFSTIWTPPFYPTGTADDRYVSDLDLDPLTGVLFFSLQDYNRRDRTTVQSFNMRTFSLTTNVNSLSMSPTKFPKNGSIIAINVTF